MLEHNNTIFLAGHRGMVGSAIKRLLNIKEYENLITKTRKELDLLDAKAVKLFFEELKPDLVILAAAKVGGIKANMSYPVEFLIENLQIQNNIINQSYKSGVKKLVFLGSSCIYPRACPQPMKEEYLLSGELEPTNEGYALAKITGLKLLEYYKKQYNFSSISIMPCNLYGTNDSFDPEHSHVLSSLVRKFVDAVASNSPEVTIWGSGLARREFMHVDDLAKAVLYLINNYHSSEFINVGWGVDISIKELAQLIALETNFKGAINWDLSKPDGMPRKCMDVSKMLKLGFRPTIELKTGIIQTINEYKKIKGYL